MFRSKFFDGIRAAQAAQRPVADLPPFDLERMRETGIGARLVSRLLEDPRGILRFLRRHRPTLVLGKFALVTRNEDVREVFERQDVFETPFGPEMAEMAGGANFILGMQDGAAYRRMKSAILTAFPPGEVEERVRPIARRHSEDLMRGAMPGVNVVAELLKIVPVRICRDYFGIVIDDEKAFADRAIALSALFFADPGGKPVTRELAVVAARDMRLAIDRSIDAARAGAVPPDTPLARLVAINAADPSALSQDEIRSAMMGMIAGFTPTNLLAAGNCLDVILSRADARNAVDEAVEADDVAALERAVLEAMRFKPIFVGPFRHVVRDTVIARGTRRETTLRKGTTVVPSILSAMFDEEAVKDPETFDPDRPARDSFVFGHGIHWCIGSAVARVQIGESLRALFARPNVRRAPGARGRLSRLGAYPETLCVDFDLPAESTTTAHSFVTIAARVPPGVSPASLRQEIAALGNPPVAGIRAAFDAAGIVHFASLSLVGRADPAEEMPDDGHHLVFEFSADGNEEEAIDSVARQAGDLLRRPFEAAGLVDDGVDFAGFMKAHAVRVSPAIRHAPGLCFTGTPGHSVRRILAEERLRAELSELLDELPSEPAQTAWQRLSRVRAELAARPAFQWAFQPAAQTLEGRAGKGADAVRAVALDPATVAGVAIALLGLSWFYRSLALAPAAGWTGHLAAWLAAGLLAVLTLVALAGFAGGIGYALLRRKEGRDAEKGEPLPAARFEPIAERENHIAHNHLAAVSVMKPGPLRRITLRLAFFAIRLAATRVFQPGRLADIGSIHYARWVLLPGTDKLLFFSNYGGSWGSYLEDFITKASKGLTGVWSNTLGYPRTRSLFLDGAENGDLFKRWAREQQIPTLFWYSAYPSLTTQHIRTNSAIRQAIATAGTDTEAAAFVARFGSVPRAPDALDTHDVQSIFFGGMGRLKQAEMVALSIPPDLQGAARRVFLDHLVAHASFGDSPPGDEAMIVAFAASGLQRLGLDASVPGAGLDAFPGVFRRGMVSSSQSRVLGDRGASDPARWRWGVDDKAADAVVVCYADTPRRLASSLAALLAAAREAGLSVTHRQPLIIKARDGKPIEHFGFRDGISQPVVDGTPRARLRADPQHRVAAGEFLLGYPDQTGRPPPPIVVPAASDRERHLAGLVTAVGESDEWRDFGRNGSYLVIRDMVQHVDLFESFCQDAAARLGGGDIDGRPAGEWVAAKMFGRWRDGSSLVQSPAWRGGRDADNAFLFGRDDPQGQACPFGSHVRRSNPRDSLGPNRETQIALSKRHRILRISRAWEDGPRRDGADGDKGILFMCLNADIERQFEFVQQTWVMNPNFAGLRGEHDPLVGNPEGKGSFTIPADHGPIRLDGLGSFVTVRGGGYFFMPGRRALLWLRARAGTDAAAPAARNAAAAKPSRRARRRVARVRETEPAD